MQRKTALSFVVYRRPKGSLSAKNGKNKYDKSKSVMTSQSNFVTSYFTVFSTWPESHVNTTLAFLVLES